MRSCGRLARWRRTARSMCSPFGRSQSNGTESFPHCNWSSSANGGSQLVHAMPATSGAAAPGDGPACAVLTAPTADIATPHTATTTDRMIARGRGLPLAPLLAITHHPSAGRAPRERLPSHLDVPEDTPMLLTALLVAERLRRATGVGARAASARDQAIPVLRWFRQDADLKVLAADTRISLATGYRYLHEGIDVLAAQAPDLHQVLERGKAGGWPLVTLEGALRASASRTADARWSWPGVPAVEEPCGPPQCTDGDDGGGQGEVGVDAGLAAFGAATESAEVVEPGVGPLDHPSLADLDGSGFAAVRDLAEQAPLVECFPAGPVVIAGVQVNRRIDR